MKKLDLKKIKLEIISFWNGQLLYVKQANSKMEYIKIENKKYVKYLFVLLALDMLFGFLLFSFTPLNDLGIFNGKTKLEREKTSVDLLNSKINYLSSEINKLRVKNEKIKFILKLSDSSGVQDSNKKLNENKPQITNNLYSIFSKIIYIFAQEKVNKFFIKPLIGYISRGFEPSKGHNGIDIIAKTGTPVFAAAPGYVVFSDFTNSSGYNMAIVHSNGYISFYKHCSRLLKKEREFVYANDVIALSGNSGEETTGPHLHFEIWKDGKPVDPGKYLLK